MSRKDLLHTFQKSLAKATILGLGLVFILHSYGFLH